MLNKNLYEQAFNLAFQNYEAAAAQSNEKNKARSEKTLVALILYMSRLGYYVHHDYSGEPFRFVKKRGE
jgi:hypothetical protein